MSSRLLQTNHLGISFKGVADIVRDASIEVFRGEVTGLAGPSGSGKSLTLWSLLGILPDHATMSGEISIYNAKGDQTVMSSPEEVRSIAGERIRIIPQNPFTSLNPVIRCGEQICEGPGKDAISKELVLKHLALLGFGDPERIYQSYPFELSGGQLQRIVIAMATIGGPELILADEPTTALDVRTQEEVLNLLLGYVKKHEVGMILVSHDLGVLHKYCDRLYSFHEGVTREFNDRGIAKHANKEYKGEVGQTRGVLLQVRDLSVDYKSRKGAYVQALNNISFDICTGEVLGIAGATGCGKSTIAKVLVGLKEPVGGEVKFRSEILDFDERPELRKEVQLIFQDPYSALYPHWTIGQYLCEAIQLHDNEHMDDQVEIVNNILERVGLNADFAMRHPHQLSGGERQRVQIARALLVRPSLLICDEITSGLDADIQEQILNLLRNLRKQQEIAFIFISHDLAVIRSLADKVIIMDEGKIVESGSTMALFSNPRHEVTRVLLKASLLDVMH